MKKKVVAACMTVALAAVAMGGATLAYFTDTEDQKNTFTVGDVDIVLDETDVNDPDERTEADQEFGVIMPGTVFVKDPTITNKGTQNAWVFLEVDLNKYVSLVNLMGVDAYANGIGGLSGKYPGFTEFASDLLSDSNLRSAVVNRWFGGIEHAEWEIMNLTELQELVGKVANGENPSHLSMILGYKTVLGHGDKATFMRTFGMPESVTQSMMNGEDAYMIDGVSKSNFNTEKSDFKIDFTAYAIQEAELDTLAEAYAALGI